MTDAIQDDIPGGDPADGSRPLQGGQRHARPPLRRPAARPGRRALPRRDRRRRPDRPPRRRRVRDHQPRPRSPGRARARPPVADALRDPFELEEMVVDVQASVGIALFPEHGHDVETLLQKADVAMYRAKETRSDVALYDERHDHHSPAKLALTAELRTAVDTRRSSSGTSPSSTSAPGRSSPSRRWCAGSTPASGCCRPAVHRMAEPTNLIKPLTQRVMEIALRQVADWHALGLDVAVAVNISAQVLVDQRFTEQVLAALRRAGVAPERLKLEVTESALMADPVTARTVLRDSRRWAARSRSTTSAPATRRWPTWPTCPSPRSRSTGRSSAACRPAPARRSSSTRPSTWPTTSSCGRSRRGSRTGRCCPSSRRSAATPLRAMPSATRWPAPTPPAGCWTSAAWPVSRARHRTGGMILIALAGLCLAACR